MHGDDNHINFSYNAGSTKYVSFTCLPLRSFGKVLSFWSSHCSSA